MILGTGIDMVDIRRIEKLLDDKFITRIFTDAEQATCNARNQRAAAYAKRFAAKEACAKALGCGIGADALFREIEITNDERGAPHITLHGAALARLQSLAPAGVTPKIFLSLSDERDSAIAQVIIDRD